MVVLSGLQSYSSKIKTTVFSYSSIYLTLLLLAIIVALAASFFVNDSVARIATPAVLATFFINGLISSIFLVKSIMDAPFSLVQIHWIFYLTMFVLAPLSQCLCGYSVWGYALSANSYLVTNVLLLVWAFLFAIISSTKSNKKNSIKRTASKDFFDSLPNISSNAAYIAIFLAVFATVVVVLLVGVDNLFSRGDYSTGLIKTANLLFEKVVRPLPVFSFALIFVRSKQQHRFSLLLPIAFLLVLISNFPTSMARYIFACLYGGLALLVITPLFNKKGLFPVLFLLAFLIILPAGNAYRYHSIDIGTFFISILDAIINIPQGFCAVDYDAYSMVARTIDYIELYGITYGYQLLGALFFFVPRVMWTTKPEGSGNMVCEAQGQQQLNISSPLPAEGLINFDIFGLLLFAVVLAVVCKKLDIWFIQSKSVFRLFYPFLCFLLFFMMRGDLLSSLAFTVGYAAAFFMFCIICLGIKPVLGRSFVNRRGGV